MVCQCEADISEGIRKLIKRGNYEKYILYIINHSVKIFGGKRFKKINKQPNGESDFVDDEGQKYDVKLLFDQELGQLLGDRKNELSHWIRKMIEIRNEFSKSIHECNLSLVKETKLYNIMLERIKSVSDEEHAILFIPFPVVTDYAGATHIQLGTDYIRAIYNCLEEQNLNNAKAMYFIYPSTKENVYVLRDSRGNRENIICEKLAKYISYRTDVL